MDDVINETKEEHRPAVRSEIDKRINLWATRMNALIKRYTSDKYVVVFSNKFLENLEAKRFAILDDVREIDEGNKIPVTLSMGVGTTGKTFLSWRKGRFHPLNWPWVAVVIRLLSESKAIMSFMVEKQKLLKSETGLRPV